MKKSIFLTVLSLSIVLWTGWTAQADVITPDLEQVLSILGADNDVPVIITLNDQIDLKAFTDKDKSKRRTRLIRDLKDKADVSQKDLKAFLKQKNVKRVIFYWIFNGMAITAPVKVIRELAGRPEIGSIRLDDTLTQPEPQPAAAVLPEWNICAIRAPAVWELGFKGAGIVVATMDTGVDLNHMDLNSRWRGGDNSWYDPNGEHSTPFDSAGHGTQVVGVIVGGDATGTAIGVAPDARWISVKIFDDAGLAEVSDIHAGFQWLLDPDNNADTDDAPDVVNNSWGFRTWVNQCYQEFQPDVQALKEAGIAVVFSAGNEGPQSFTSVSPANYPESMAVGAIDNTSTVALFSSRGPSACTGPVYPGLVGPGVGVKTADLTYAGIFPYAFAYVSGTSFSAAHVSGGLALLISAFPDATVTELENALKESAQDLGIQGPDDDYGCGLLDVLEAYNLLLAQSVGSNEPPVAVDDTASTPRNVPVLIDVLMNDYDPDGTIDPDATQSVTITTSPTRSGTVEALACGIWFTPRRNYRGTDVFRYTIVDNEGALSNEATVRVNILRH